MTRQGSSLSLQEKAQPLTSRSVSLTVRQGSREGPILFLLCMNACLGTMEWPASIAKPTFACDRTAGPKGTWWDKHACLFFEAWHSLFADDFGVFFETRADLIIGSQFLFSHL